MTSTTLEKEMYTISDNKIDRLDEILTSEAIAFVCMLQDRFGSTREELLMQRNKVQCKIDLVQLEKNY